MSDWPSRGPAPGPKAPFWWRHGVTLFAVLPASLFLGLMVASAGVAVHPPVAFLATPLVCPGEVAVESQNYSYRPGQRGISRTIYCVTRGAGGKPAREDITFKAIGASFLVYSAIAFVLLQLLAWLVRRRLAGLFRWKGVRAAPGAGMGAGAAGAGVDLQAILAQVADAVDRGDARVSVRNMSVDLRDGDGPAGDDPAARLARLKRLYEQGLINAADYEAKKAEILSGL